MPDRDGEVDGKQDALIRSSQC